MIYDGCVLLGCGPEALHASGGGPRAHLPSGTYALSAAAAVVQGGRVHVVSSH